MLFSARPRDFHSKTPQNTLNCPIKNSKSTEIREITKFKHEYVNSQNYNINA